MKIFYGWKMVGAAAAIQFLQAGLLHQAMGAYVATLTEERGWSKTALAGGAALQSIEAALLGPLLGWIVDKFGARGMVRFGIVTFGLGFVWLSQIETIAGFYSALIVIAIGTSFSGFFPLTVALVQWFEKHRARALSLQSMGLALGGVFVPVVAWSMQAYGWRATAFACGILVIVLGWPLAKVMKSRPEDHGETVDGLPPVSPAAQRADISMPAQAGAASTQVEFTFAQAIRTRAFWLISLGHGFALLVVTSVNVHAITHMRIELNYSLAQASLVITLMTVAQIAGVGLGWLIGDRFDKRWVAAGCMLAHMIGLLMLTFALGPLMLGGFAILHGVAWGLRGPFMQAIRADYFGRRAIGKILGVSTAIIAIGQVGGPMIAGLSADLLGNYRAGFTLLALFAGAGSLFFVLARKPKLPAA